MVGTCSQPTSVKDYLRKYTSNDDEEMKKKKQRKAKTPHAAAVVDDDPDWQKPIKLDDEQYDSADEEKPPRVESNIPNANNQSSDLSPPRRRRRRNDTPSPESQSRRQHDRRGYKYQDDSPRKRRKESPICSLPKIGLISRDEIKEEIDRMRKEEWLKFQEMDDSVNGRYAEPIYRDRLTGERISKDEFLKFLKKEEKPKEIKVEWSKGLAQKREAEARLIEMEEEREKPFARSRDDPDLDAMLRERARWGDPMAHLVKKKHLELVFQDLGDSEMMKESGFVIPQEISRASWIRRGVDAAPNRYGIKPGRHWDGEDRSNGHEKELFERMNEEKAAEKKAYLWAVSDM